MVLVWSAMRNMMAQTNPYWQRLPDRYKWLVRLGMSIGAIGNAWGCYRHAAAHNPLGAAIDAVFVAVCLGFIYQSF
jgi:hypothetical protein